MVYATHVHCSWRGSSIYFDRMSLAALHQRTKRLVLFSVALSLLFVQGVRLCVHPDAHAVSGDAVAGARTVHYESIGNADDGANHANQHLPLGSALVKLTSDIPFVFLVAALFLIGIISRALQAHVEFKTSPLTRVRWSLRPPLRAPPL